jgi:polysaccharide export outer membrane protein
MISAARWILSGLLFLAPSFASAAQGPAGNAAPTQKPGSSSKSPASEDNTSTKEADYRIGPQDVIRIDVWKEPDVSRSVPVRPDGKISMPLLNDVQAAGLTSMELAASIREGLSKFMTNPQVTITVSDINSRRIYVTGEVARQGAQTLLPNMTVLQALATAGGLTQFARAKKIYIVRTVDGKQVTYPFDYKGALTGKHPETNILLQSGDMIVVP